MQKGLVTASLSLVFALTFGGTGEADSKPSEKSINEVGPILLGHASGFHGKTICDLTIHDLELAFIDMMQNQVTVTAKDLNTVVTRY